MSNYGLGETQRKDAAKNEWAKATVLARLGALLHDLCHIPAGHTVDLDREASAIRYQQRLGAAPPSSKGTLFDIDFKAGANPLEAKRALAWTPQTCRSFCRDGGNIARLGHLVEPDIGGVDPERLVAVIHRAQSELLRWTEVRHPGAGNWAFLGVEPS